MRVIIKCQRCGHTRNAQELTWQNRQGPDGIGVPPRGGDFWLCGECGYIHVFYASGDLLVTQVANGEEILEALLLLPDMIEERNRILSKKGLPS